MKRIGLTLGGGGARGFAHIPFLQVFDDLDIKPSIISGTSIGAIMGALYSSGHAAREILDIVHNLDLISISKMVDLNILNTKGLVKGKGIESFLSKHLKAKTFEELDIPLKIVATDLWDQSEVVIEEGNLVQAIRASISIPAIFEPVKTRDRVLVDGGLCNPVPYDIIRDQCDLLVAVDVAGSVTIPRDRPVPNLFENIMISNQILQKSILVNKMQVCKPDIFLTPKLEGIRILAFEKTDEIIASAALDAVKFKKQLKQQLFPSRKLFSFFSRK